MKGDKYIMSSFNANINSQAFNVATENELAEVLSHYSSEFVFSIVSKAMKSRYEGLSITVLPNVVGAWEQNFKAIIAQYGESCAAEVYQVRNETYREIINTICREFSLNFTIDDSVDLYSAAFHLYNMFVCGFGENMTSFFANYIYKERATIYEALNLGDLKKNKDSSTIYSKRVFKDSKLGTINANIDMVISQVCGMDFPFYSIIMTICGANSELAKYYLSIVSANDDFFEKAYISILNSDIRPEIITGIRFKLQEIAVAHDQIEANDIVATT